MNVFIQLVSFEQGIEQFKLFNLAKSLLPKSGTRERFSWISLNGRTKSVKSLAGVCSNASTAKFSQIGYSAAFKPFKLRSDVTLKEAFGVLEIPTTSPFWAGPEYWQQSIVPSAYRRARSARRTLSTIMRSKIKTFPAVLELTLRMNSKLRPDEFADVMTKWMVQSFGVDAVRCLDCGIVDFGDSMLFSKMGMVNLSAAELSLVFFMHSFILGTPLLKTHIDRLHGIHILPQKTSSFLARRLGLSKPLALGNKLAVVVTPQKVLGDPNAIRRVSKFVIPRDDSTSWEGIIKREGVVPVLAKQVSLPDKEATNAQEMLIEEIKHQPEPVLREVLNYMRCLKRQREE